MLAGLVTRDNMFDGLALGTMGGTYGAAPLACATANATLDVIQDENLLDNSTARGRQLVEVCQECSSCISLYTWSSSSGTTARAVLCC